jgi:hypothetical protein
LHCSTSFNKTIKEMKKLLTLIAGIVLSFNASASYTQYNFSSDVGSDISGFFVQRDDDKSIAFYDIHVKAQYVSAHFAPSGPFDNILSAHNNYSTPGPTSFTIFDDSTDFYYEGLSINFESDNPAFAFAARYQQQVAYPTSTTGAHPLTLAFDGIMTRSEYDPAMGLDLDQDQGGVRHIVPNQVPEPATLGLFALGAFAAGAARRRKAAR